MSKFILFFVILYLPVTYSFANSRCGPFLLSTSEKNDGWARVNGQKPESQKVIFLKAQNDFSNVKIQWMLLNKSTGRWFGLDYIKRDEKAILNVEYIQESMDEPHIYSTYDCVKAK